MIFLDSRAFPCTSGNLLEGAIGEGCNDARRYLRKRPQEMPITSLGNVEEFLFSHCPGGNMFVELLRELSPLSEEYHWPHIVPRYSYMMF